MSLPSRSKFSLAHSASSISQPRLCFPLSLPAFFPSRLATYWRLRAFLEFSGPPAILPMQRLCKFHFRVTHFSPGFPSWLRGVLGLSHPLDASFRIGLSDLVSYRCRPWASIMPSKVLPFRSPGCLSARGVLLVVVDSRRPCGRRSSIGSEDVSIGWVRCRRSACLARLGARSFLGCFPLRGIWLLGLAPRFRGAPLLGFS
jgi:hypothetical protein